MDQLKPEIERLFRAKEARRAQLAALSYHEKVQIVVQMQQIAAPLLRARGKQVCIWSLNNLNLSDR